MHWRSRVIRARSAPDVALLLEIPKWHSGGKRMTAGSDHGRIRNTHQLCVHRCRSAAADSSMAGFGGNKEVIRTRESQTKATTETTY